VQPEEIPARQLRGILAKRVRLVLQGTAAMMVLVALAAALQPGATQGFALQEAAASTVVEQGALSTGTTEQDLPVTGTPDQAASPSSTTNDWMTRTTPAPTRIVGPSEAQWIAWEDAHGLPKECEPKKEWTTGPHGEKVFTYYADCSMREQRPSQATLKAANAAVKGNQGEIVLATKKAKTPVTTPSVVKPTLAADKKANAKKALMKKSAADFEPPTLPSMLQKRKPKVEKVVAVKQQDLSAQKDLKKMMGAKKSNKPETIAQKIRRVFFTNKVKQEERKLIAQDDQRADSLIIDPDEHVANGQWGSAAKLKAKPVPKLAKLSVKATGPAAAILQMVSGEGDLE